MGGEREGRRREGERREGGEKKAEFILSSRKKKIRHLWY